MKLLLTISLALFGLASYFLPEPEFSYKIYGNMANFFESKTDLLDFFEFNKGETVAEVGTGDGKNLLGLSLLTDSIKFYAQDINTKTLNQNHFDKLKAKIKKYKDPLTNTFELVTGEEKRSLLPDNSCDKIILSATFHEFTYMNEMMADLYKKLKPGGKLYVLESVCFSKTHKNYSAEDAIQIIQAHGFNLLKKDGKDINGAKGLYRLVFVKK